VIHPVPTGVNPNSHTCGCGGTLRMPWIHGLQDHALVCTVDQGHDTYMTKYKRTRMLKGAQRRDVEVDILTGQETSTLAVQDEGQALDKVHRANGLGLFPTKNSTPDQLALIAQVAFLYGLDPLMGEIMPYQGRPYITIGGRRRLDAVAGNAVSVSFRLLTLEEREYYTEVGALNPRDIAGFCVGHNPKTNVTVEGFGRVLASETRGDSHLPVVSRQIEMAQKRQERRMREMMFGPVAKPAGLGDIAVLEEGDESEVIETTGRVVEPPEDELPDLGNCPEHQVGWRVQEFHGRIVGSHFVDGEPWCKFANIYSARLRGAWEARHGGYNKTEVDTWLKATFRGRTWSKMDAPEQLEALTLMTTVEGGPESNAQAPSEGEPTESSPGDDWGPEPAQDAASAISREALSQLMHLADGAPISSMDLIQHIEKRTGDADPSKITVDHYDEILGWVNQQIDAQIVKADH
jgi:hypothetical protein